MNKPTKGISVDGSCRGNPGDASYRAVDIETGRELFKENIGEATNNIAEFLGLCHAIWYNRKNKINSDIYCDSVTAIAWVRNKQAKSTFKSPKIQERLTKAEEYLKTIDTIEIKKWDTKNFGEIPADFGLKK